MLVALFTLCAALLDSEAEADALSLSLSEGSDDADELASSLAEEEDSAEEDDDSAELEEAVELAAAARTLRTIRRGPRQFEIVDASREQSPGQQAHKRSYHEHRHIGYEPDRQRTRPSMNTHRPRGWVIEIIRRVRLMCFTRVALLCHVNSSFGYTRV
jgi:hypothetical protein